jgi:curved DNA-binding protein
MKYKDYYEVLGVARDADAATIKKAYRRLAQKYHPDISKEPGAEEKFKEIAEAWDTLGSAEKRAAYDELGSRPSGQEFRPPPGWDTRFGGAGMSFDDIDLADLFAGLSGGRARTGRARGGTAMPGQDYEVAAHITLEDAYRGTVVDLGLTVPEYDDEGRVRRVQRRFKARIPQGATDGQRLRLKGRGGKGYHGGPDGDLYLDIALHPHPLYRVDGHDLYLELPLAPWEAALGATVDVPTPGGPVALKIPPGTAAGHKLRLSKRGLPRPSGHPGDLLAIVQIAVPTVLTERDRGLFRQLAEGSTFNPRGHFEPGLQR